MYGPAFTKGYQGRGFQALNSTDIYVLGTNGNLWYEMGPWGQVPPPRQQVDGNVAAFCALSGTEAYVLGTNGNLWHETGPWGQVPPARQQVDGNVAAFQPVSSTQAFVLGTDGKLWLETGPWGTVPPSRIEIGGVGVAAFQALGSAPGSEVFVLGNNGTLWLNTVGGGTAGQQVGGDGVAAFAVAPGTTNQVYVLGTNGTLWLNTVGEGTSAPQIDGNVAAFQPLSTTEAYVLGTNGNLWHETGPWGQVPPPRQQVDGNALSFHALSSTEAYVEGTDSYLWHETGPWGQGLPSRQQVDANVWPDNGIIMNSYPNVSGLDGTATLRVYEAGGYHFSGGWTPSNPFTGALAQDVNFVFTLRDSKGTLWVFSTAGTVPIEGSYNFDYWGTFASLAESWPALAAGYTGQGIANAGIDLLATGNEIINWYDQNKNTINAVVQVVGFIAGLV